MKKAGCATGAYRLSASRGDEHGNVKKTACRAGGAPPKFEAYAGFEFEMEVDLVLLAMGFTGPVRGGMVEDLGVALDARGNVAADENYMSSVPGVFAAGDTRRGQSLVVWAIAEGRKAARGIDEFLMGALSCRHNHTAGTSGGAAVTSSIARKSRSRCDRLAHISVHPESKIFPGRPSWRGPSGRRSGYARFRPRPQYAGSRRWPRCRSFPASGCPSARHRTAPARTPRPLRSRYWQT